MFLLTKTSSFSFKEMEKEFLKYSKEDHEQYDCFGCFILSHGISAGVYGVDGKVVDIQKILDMFNSQSCQSLVGKPKLFFIQACRGSEYIFLSVLLGADGNSPRSQTVLFMFSSPKGLMVVSIVEMSQEFKSDRLTIFYFIFSFFLFFVCLFFLYWGLKSLSRIFH